ADCDGLHGSHQSIRLDEREAEVQVPRQTLGGMPIQGDFAHPLHYTLAQPIAQPSQALSLVVHLAEAEVAGLAEADHARHGQGAAAHATLVAAPVHLRREANVRIPPPHVQGPDSLGTIYLMS